MLEHADADDSIKGLVDFTIIHELEVHLVVEPALLRFLTRDTKLLLGERDTSDANSSIFGQVHGKASPAAANIQYVLPLAQLQLMQDMLRLGILSVFERLILALEIGAGVVHVLVEKGAKQGLIEVVVMAHVAST